MQEPVIRWESHDGENVPGVYLVGFDDGVTKYGMSTSDVSTRIQINRRKKRQSRPDTGGSLDADVVGAWVHSTPKPRAAEIALHRCFVDVPRAVDSKSSEWLDLHVDEVIELSSGLDYWPTPAATLSEIEDQQEEIRNALETLSGLGEVLREIRREIGLKQAELAEEMDMKTGVLSRLETQNPLIEFDAAMSIIQKYRAKLLADEEELPGSKEA